MGKARAGTDENDEGQEHDQLTHVLNALPDAVVVVDGSGVVCFVNRAAETLFGHRRDELLGRPPTFSMDQHGPVRLDIVTPGRIVEGELHVSKVIWDGEDALVAFIRDLTEWRRETDRRRRAEELDAVGRLAGGIAHDFNNLLTGVMTFTSLVRDSFDATDERRTDLGQVLISGSRAVQLTRNLLAFSRREPSIPAPSNLSELIEGLSSLLEQLLGDRIALSKQLSPTLALVLIDPRHFERIVTNLVVNARDAMPSGGTLSITTRNDTDATLGDCVLCRIADTGHGMTEDVKRNLFHPFFTTKSPGAGSGLGLATVYGLLLQAKAVVEIDSVVGRGTAFELRFPRAAAAAHGVQTRSISPHAGTTRTRGPEAILLAEDEPIVRSSVGRMLRRGGYTFFEARTGREALEIFDEHRDEIRLAVLDVVMPELSGPETAMRLRARAPALKILFMSGYPRDLFEANKEARELGPLIQKPMSEGALLAAVRQLLDTHAEETAEAGDQTGVTR
ncbi:MAG TPA: ATP-binding protein [Polyangiaceae bacterium]|nr:ATP-binding protein [Polyangiaceae bacterium]